MASVIGGSGNIPGPVIYGLLAYKDSLLFTKLPFSLFTQPGDSPSIDTAASFSLNSSPSKLNPTCLCAVNYSPTTAAILDLIQYYHLVNMCLSASVCKSEAAVDADIVYTEGKAFVSRANSGGGNRTEVELKDSQPRPEPKLNISAQNLQPRLTKGRITCNTKATSSPTIITTSSRKIRKYIMSPEISLGTFDREFLHQLMLQKFESPFEDDFQVLTDCDTTAATSTVTARPCSLDLLNQNMVIELVHPDMFGSSKTKLSQILESSSRLANHYPSAVSSKHVKDTRRQSFWKRLFIS